MKLITRDTDYALRAVCFIAVHKDRVVSVAELVRRLKVPRPFLRKLLQELNKKQVLHSSKGQGGGFLLAKPKEQIFLSDLIKIFQGGLRLNACFLKKNPCPNKKSCILRKKICRIEEYVAGKLNSISIASLLR